MPAGSRTHVHPSGRGRPDLSVARGHRGCHAVSRAPNLRSVDAALEVARSALALDPADLAARIDGGRLALAYLPHLGAAEQRRYAGAEGRVRLWEAVARFRAEVEDLAQEANAITALTRASA